MKPIVIRWDADANDMLEIKTRKLAHIFGVDPSNQHPVIQTITWECDIADRSCDMLVDPRISSNTGLTFAESDGVAGGEFEYGRDQVHMSVTEALEPHKLEDLNMPIFDEMHFVNDGNAQVWTINIFFDVKGGAMYLLDDMAINVGDITQVTPDRSAGMEYFQVGPVSQIGSTEFGN